MTVVNRVLQQLKRGDQVTGSMIAELINEHNIPRTRMIGLFNRYKTDPSQPWHCVGNSRNIFQRTFQDATKVNNQVNVDHFSNIINTKTGYFVGEAITYTVDEKAKNKDLIETKMKEFLNRIDTIDLDTETGKMASICGYAARLCYINDDGKEDAMDIPPWECIFLSKDESITDPDYALRYYKTVEVLPLGGTRDVIKAEWYDNKNVTFWKQTTAPPPTGLTQDPATPQNAGLVWGFDPDEIENPKPHMFSEVPLIGFPNNEELQGDADKVLALIDAYDRTVSDQNSEIEQFRMAYLAIYGYASIDDKFIESLKKTGVMGFDSPEDRAEFITKQIDTAFIENHLNRLEQEIYAISGIPNLRDEAFSGNSSGVALKFKIFPMEVKCKMAENKFAAALHQQFRVIGSKWQLEDVKFNSDDLVFKFKRNFPLNLADEAQTATNLTGIVSKETVLSTLSIVKNIPEEMARIKKEQAEEVDLNKALYPDLPQNPPGGEPDGMQGQKGQGKEKVTAGPAAAST